MFYAGFFLWHFGHYFFPLIFSFIYLILFNTIILLFNIIILDLDEERI